MKVQRFTLVILLSLFSIGLVEAQQPVNKRYPGSLIRGHVNENKSIGCGSCPFAKEQKKSNHVEVYYCYDWITAESKWEIGSRDIYNYNAEGKLESMFTDYKPHPDSQWTNYYKYTYEYDSNNFQTKYIAWQWVESKNKWRKDTKQTSLTWDSDTNFTGSWFLSWDSAQGQWVRVSKDTVFYNAMGRQKEWLRMEWNEQKGKWVNKWRYTNYDFDMQGNIIKQDFQEWDTSHAQWVTGYRDSIEYGKEGKWDRRVTQRYDTTHNNWFYTFNEDYKIDTGLRSNGAYVTTRYDTATDQWQNSYKCEYKDTIIQTGTEELFLSSGASFTVYPNPAQDRVVLSFDKKRERSNSLQVEVYNLEGERVMARQYDFRPRLEVKFADIPQGLYMIRLREEDGKIIGHRRLMVY